MGATCSKSSGNLTDTSNGGTCKKSRKQNYFRQVWLKKNYRLRACDSLDPFMYNEMRKGISMTLKATAAWTNNGDRDDGVYNDDFSTDDDLSSLPCHVGQYHLLYDQQILDTIIPTKITLGENDDVSERKPIESSLPDMNTNSTEIKRTTTKTQNSTIPNITVISASFIIIGDTKSTILLPWKVQKITKKALVPKHLRMRQQKQDRLLEAEKESNVNESIEKFLKKTTSDNKENSYDASSGCCLLDPHVEWPNKYPTRLIVRCRHNKCGKRSCKRRQFHHKDKSSRDDINHSSNTDKHVYAVRHSAQDSISPTNPSCLEQEQCPEAKRKRNQQLKQKNKRLPKQKIHQLKQQQQQQYIISSIETKQDYYASPYSNRKSLKKILPDAWVSISEKHDIYVVDVGLSPSQCDRIVQVTELACKGKYASYTYAKQTLGCREYPLLSSVCAPPVLSMVQSILSFSNNTISNKKTNKDLISKEAQQQSSTPLENEDGTKENEIQPRLQTLHLDDREPHIVKYDSTKRERQKLDMHTDKSEWTFLIALSNGCGLDYDGGGTYFECLNTTVHISRGHALVFPGKLRHCGQRITNGLRYLLVGFLVNKNNKKHIDNIVNQKNSVKSVSATNDSIGKSKSIGGDTVNLNATTARISDIQIHPQNREDNKIGDNDDRKGVVDGNSNDVNDNSKKKK